MRKESTRNEETGSGVSLTAAAWQSYNQGMIYLDNGATTPLSEQARSAMKPYLEDLYGNAMAVYRLGAQSRQAVEEARGKIAAVLGTKPEEIYFTSGGTESDNWAVEIAAAEAGGGHILLSAVEHPAVYNKCMAMKARGFAVELLPVDQEGQVSPEAAAAAIRPDTILLSVMTANNEVGTIQPISAIAAVAARENERRRQAGTAQRLLLHTDAVQAVGHIPCTAASLGIDMLSASAHKFGGPKGAGFLYIRKGVPVHPLLIGGAQERSMRGGTHNVPGIVGMGAALAEAAAQMDAHMAREKALRDRLIDGLRAAVPGCRINGSLQDRLPGCCHVTMPGVPAESALFRLDRAGICASAGSACEAGAVRPSRTLLAMGQSEEEARCSLRLTLSYRNTEDEIEETVRTLAEIAASIRALQQEGK